MTEFSSRALSTEIGGKYFDNDLNNQELFGLYVSAEQEINHSFQPNGIYSTEFMGGLDAILACTARGDQEFGASVMNTKETLSPQNSFTAFQEGENQVFQSILETQQTGQVNQAQFMDGFRHMVAAASSGGAGLSKSILSSVFDTPPTLETMTEIYSEAHKQIGNTVERNIDNPDLFMQSLKSILAIVAYREK